MVKLIKKKEIIIKIIEGKKRHNYRDIRVGISKELPTYYEEFNRIVEMPRQPYGGNDISTNSSYNFQPPHVRVWVCF